MRVFTAVDIQEPTLLKKLEKLRNKLDYGFNLVPPKKMHITLQFFQDVNDEEVDQIIQAMRDIELDSFSLEVRGVGVFPSKEHVRVVWAGIDSDEIYELKQQVATHQVESEDHHEFNPHITLARVDDIARTDKKEFRMKLEELENEKIGSLEVNSVKLFESVQTGRGTKYELLEKVSLTE